MVPAPESAAASVHPHTFESDWYQFGCLLAQLFANVDPSLTENPRVHSALLNKVRDASKLAECERDLVCGLLEFNPDLRLSRGFEILSAIDDIVVRLDQPARFVENSYLALAVLLGPNRKLTEAISEIDESISALDTEGAKVVYSTGSRDSAPHRAPNFSGWRLSPPRQPAGVLCERILAGQARNRAANGT